MRITVVCIALLLAVVFSAPANPAVVNLNGTATDEEALKRLSQALMQAVEKKDQQTLEALIAPEYSLQVPGSPERTGRGEWISNAMKKDWSNFRYEHLAVRVDGDHATVTSKLYFKIAPIPLMLDSGVVDIWIKRAGRWQVTARYLGESAIQLRIAFILGLLTASFLIGAWYGLVRLSKARNPGST